ASAVRTGSTGAAPGVDSEAEPAADRSSAFPARLPELFPIGEFSRLLELVRVHFGARREAGVFSEYFHRVDSAFGREVLDGGAGEVGRLLVIGCAPCLCAAGVHRYRDVIPALVGDL